MGVITMEDLNTRILKFNQGRDPHLLEVKFKSMQANPVAFFRATCHLFYEDWPANSPLNAAPALWICGDLHLSNFGSYKGDNRQVYFDINDFDEAVLAPCTWDLARFLTSLFLGLSLQEISQPEIMRLGRLFLHEYCETVAKGHAYSVEDATAEGVVKDLLESLEKRQRKAFLDERTYDLNSKRKLKLTSGKVLPITSAEKEKITTLYQSWATRQPDQKFYKLLDVARRIAGQGSLGVDRYILLVEGKGSPDHNYLLDLKARQVSALHPYVKQPQPTWSDEATRVVTIQRIVQAVSPALLAVVKAGDKSFVLQELQPSQDKVTLEDCQGKLSRIEKLVNTLAQITAWGQLRSCDKEGATTVKKLKTFAQNLDWQPLILQYAWNYSGQVLKDYEAFKSNPAKI